MSAKEIAINNNFEYRENKNEINIDKIIDDLGNVDFFMCIDKNKKEIYLYFDKKETGSSNKTTLDNFTLDLILKIKQELGWKR